MRKLDRMSRPGRRVSIALARKRGGGVATTKPLGSLAFWPSFPRIFCVFCLFCLVFVSAGRTWAQDLPQNQLPTTKPVANTREKSRAELERELLLPLLLQERELLTHCGPDHPDLLAVQGRIAGMKDYLANLPAPTPERIPVQTSTTSTTNFRGGNWTTATPQPLGKAFERATPNPKPVASVDINLTGYSAPARSQPHDRDETSAPTNAKLVGSSTPFPSKNDENSITEKRAVSSPKGLSTEKVMKPVSFDSIGAPSPKALDPEMKPASATSDQQPASFGPAKAAPIAEEARASDLYLRVSGRQFVGFFAAVLLCLFVQSAVFCVLLRRYAQNLVPASYLQLAQQQVGAGSPIGSSVVDNSIGAPEPRSKTGGSNLDPPAFDLSAVVSLGSTWAEELQKKEEEEARQGEAIFQQLFKQNMQLRAQVSAASEVS
jgi:hypothetical protein